MDKKLNELYYLADDTRPDDGVTSVYRRGMKDHVPHITRNAVRDCLSRQLAYSLDKPAKRHFPRNRIHVGSIDKQWQADFADMVRL